VKREEQRTPSQSKPVDSERRKIKSKKPWIIGAVVVLLLIVVAGPDKDKTPEASTPTIEPTTISDNRTPEPGTSAMVDQIILTAKADASGSEGEAKAVAAYEWIVQTVPQWYEGSEIMEQAIYNGAIVQYYYAGRNDIRSNVGTNVIQSVKYVYRGVETVLDDSTRENIRQIKKGIEKDREN
jgi:hypothetical protein